MRTYLVTFMVTVLCLADSAWATRRSLKKRIETPTQWYGSADISYSNWIKDRLEGGGESQSAGFQLGLNLPRNVATYIRFSYMPEPVGILDLRAGISKSISFGNSIRNSWSSSLSAPTSEYSRSIHQTTQASLASTLEYSRGN
ncbi:MAG: hypothetical protein M3Q07_10070, partial [Pseudobdellovibrionaceae bacterium]|nr:hypothetical protein [Pseudobdellovibrionaceae bacterium]